MLTCKDASHLISENQERPLGFRERWSLRMHLWMCISCRRFERQMATCMRRCAADAGQAGRESPTGDARNSPPRRVNASARL
jgi:hypothetical protein